MTAVVPSPAPADRVPAPAAKGPAAPVAPSPHPLVATMPAVFQEDPFTARFCAALDQVLLPVLTVLDGFPAYLDPATAPEAFVDWLGSWVGLTLDPAWPLDRRRALVAAAAHLHAGRGTRAALEQALRLATGSEPRIVESGATMVSTEASTGVPGADDPFLLVQVPSSVLAGGGERALRTLLAMLVPAHVPWELSSAD